MLLRKALLGLATCCVAAGPVVAQLEPPASVLAAKPSYNDPIGINVWTAITAEVWELLVENLTFPLGTATTRESDAALKW